MRLTSATLWLLCVCCFTSFAVAWDNEQLEVFDVVEEVNQNFYTLLGVPQVKWFFEISFPDISTVFCKFYELNFLGTSSSNLFLVLIDKII